MPYICASQDALKVETTPPPDEAQPTIPDGSGLGFCGVCGAGRSARDHGLRRREAGPLARLSLSLSLTLTLTLSLSLSLSEVLEIRPPRHSSLLRCFPNCGHCVDNRALRFSTSEPVIRTSTLQAQHFFVHEGGIH